MIKTQIQIRIKTAIALLFLLILMMSYNFISTYVLIIFGVISILEFFEITKKIFVKDKLKFLINTLFVIFISFYCIYFFYFLNFLKLKILIFILLFGCVASDSGGYIIGKFFKGPRLTKISPNKTYSGAIGSIVFTCFVITFFTYIFTNNFSYKIIVLSILTSISCQIGDLFFSYLKRKAKIKDTGKILPGHGGILDRIDGILFGVPTGLISLIILS